MDQPAPDPLANLPTDDSDDTFEVVVERQRQRLGELVDKFESVVFEPLVTSDAEIREFLDDLFTDEEAQKALEKLRNDVAEASEKLMTETAPFDEESLTSCIKGLLTEDILSDEKQAILRDFLESEVAKLEIADVLNMRYSDLKQWCVYSTTLPVILAKRADSLQGIGMPAQKEFALCRAPASTESIASGPTTTSCR